MEKIITALTDILDKSKVISQSPSSSNDEKDKAESDAKDCLTVMEFISTIYQDRVNQSKYKFSS
jgi:hypothetical protein